MAAVVIVTASRAHRPARRRRGVLPLRRGPPVGGIHDQHDPQRGREGEQEPHIVDHGRVPQDEPQGGDGQGVQQVRLTVQQDGQEEHVRHHGGPHHRGASPGQGRVARDDQQAHGGPGPDGHPEEPEEEVEGSGQDAHVEAGDGQDVIRAGLEEGIVHRLGDVAAVAQEHGLHEPSRGRGKRAVDRLEQVLAERVDRAEDGQPTLLRDVFQDGLRRHPSLQGNPLGPQVAGRVEGTGVQVAAGASQAHGASQPVAVTGPPVRLVHGETGAAEGRDPPVRPPQRRHVQQEAKA